MIVMPNSQAQRVELVREWSKRLLFAALRLFLGALPLGCNTTEDSNDAGAADAVVCQGDHFAGDVAALSLLVDCSRLSGDLIFTGNEIAQIELSELRSVDGNLSIWGNPNLITVKLSRLVRVGGYFLVEANDRLMSVDLPVLTSINERAVMHHADVSISDNPQLPTCQATAVREQLQARGFGGSFKISANLGTCSE